MKDGTEVELRLIEAKDIKYIWENFNDIIKMGNLLPVYSGVHSEWEKQSWFEEITHGTNCCIVAELTLKPKWKKNFNPIVGQLTLENIEWEASSHVSRLGIIIQRQYQNQGLGKIMLDFSKKKAVEMKKSKIILSTFADNGRALHLYEKVGFEKVGYRKKHFMMGGAYIDEILMEIHLSLSSGN